MQDTALENTSAVFLQVKYTPPMGPGNHILGIYTREILKNMPT